jgi:NAD(P)-dependent dehydrogenase (short-subunit alcohol dehydrogenase family)
MSQRVVLISGCDTGFGRLTAEQLAERGFIIIAGCLKQDSVDELSKITNIDAVLLNVTLAEHRNEIAKRIKVDYPQGLYALINNAGIGTGGSVFDAPGVSESDEQVWNVNFVGAVELTRAVMSSLRHYALSQRQINKPKYPRVLNVTSVLGRMALPKLLAYCASKHALEAATNCLRMEFACFGIFFSCIEPWWTKTPIVTNIASHTLTRDDPWWSDDAREIRTLYGEDYTEKQLQSFKDQLNSGVLAGGVRILEPQEVVDVFVEAIETPSPKRQYLITPPRAQVIVRLQEWLPEFIDGGIIIGQYQDKQLPAVIQDAAPRVNTWDPNGKLPYICKLVLLAIVGLASIVYLTRS